MGTGGGRGGLVGLPGQQAGSKLGGKTHNLNENFHFLHSKKNLIIYPNTSETKKCDFLKVR
jgi:hypothetical protein